MTKFKRAVLHSFIHVCMGMGMGMGTGNAIMYFFRSSGRISMAGWTAGASPSINMYIFQFSISDTNISFLNLLFVHRNPSFNSIQ